MTRAPDPARPDIARLLDESIPATAHAVAGEGFAALAWAVGMDDTGSDIADVVYVLDGMTMAGILHGVAADAVGRAELAAAENVQVAVGRPFVAHRAPHGPPHPMRREVLAALAAGCDGEVVDLMLRTGLRAHGVHDWMVRAGPDRAAVVGFVRAHPWLASMGAALPGLMPMVRTDPDGAAAHILEGLGAGGAARGLAVRMRGFALHDQIVEVGAPDELRGLAALPPALFPAPLAGDEPVESAAQQGYLGLFAVAKHVVRLAAASGRTPAEVVGRNPGWDGYVLRLARRAGVEGGPDDFPGEWGWILAEDSLFGISETVHRFAAEVLRPACMMVRPGEAAPPAPRLRVFEIPEGSLSEAAARLLLGDRTLPALAEVSARWHARADGIARLLVALAGDGAPAGPRLFEDVDLGEGRYLTSLHAAQALIDEGAPGLDAAGIPGLSHCVGGYGEAVALGSAAIVSLRRRTADGFVRVSTAEVDFTAAKYGQPPYVEQHRGFANAAPGGEADALLARGLARVAGEALSRIEAYRAARPAPFDWCGAIAASGAWERVRDAWSFALPKPLRSAGPAEILAAAGYLPGSDAPRRAA